MKSRRIVITGLGMVTPLGVDVDSTWQAVLAGKSGVSVIKHFDTTEFATKICATVPDFDASLYMHNKVVRRTAEFTHYAMAASAQAVEDAKLKVTDDNSHRVGVAIGSGIGGIHILTSNFHRLETMGPKKVSPFFIPSGIINMAAGQVSINYGLKGPNLSLVSACTTGAHNIGIAARMIAYGDADVMVAGGTEAATTPLCIAGFNSARALSKKNECPEAASRPWDKDRDGFVLGEGAGVLILESLEHATARGAKIYAELSGFGMSGDANHITMPDEQGHGGSLAMNNALADAGINPSDIQYLNAHSTSTLAGDEIELLAIKRSFGEHAYQLAVSSTKSMTGHLLGAAGAVEAIFSILAIRDQVAPPTINLDNPDHGCDLNFVPHTAQPMAIKTAMSNSFGFGGTNGTLIFQQHQ